MLMEASSQSSTISTYSYHPASADKVSWQRLNLWLSYTFIFVAKEGQADWDSSLLLAGRSLGMSLIAGLSEDIDGNFSLESSNGTTVKILFVHDLVVKRRDPMNVSSVSNN